MSIPPRTALHVLYRQMPRDQTDGCGAVHCYLASSDSDAPNCNYIINGTFKAIAISSVRATVEELNDPKLKAKCTSTDEPPPPPPPPPSPPPQPGDESGLPEQEGNALVIDDDDDDDDDITGAVVGGVVGGLAAVLAFLVALTYVIKKKPVLAIRKHAAQAQASPVPLPAVGVKVRAANDKEGRDSGGPSIRV